VGLQRSHPEGDGGEKARSSSGRGGSSGVQHEGESREIKASNFLRIVRRIFSGELLLLVPLFPPPSPSPRGPIRGRVGARRKSTKGSCFSRPDTRRQMQPAKRETPTGANSGTG